ncbi:MAG TPA: maleylpyruvate isomerase family mycothiol-dependent enzyme [Acidimicrobiia bacterium]
MNRHELSDVEVDELLGAYALDALDPDELVAVEAVLARRPDLALEAARLSSVAAWLGATEAAEPPGGMRDTVLTAALARRRGPADPVVDVYLSLSDRLEQAIVELPDDALDVVTPNGLTASELIVHMAAQESLLAQNLGTPTVDDLDEEDITSRTHALLSRFAGRELDDAVALWRTSVEANRAWAVANPDRTAIWRGLGLTRDDTLLVRAFEAWVHADDLRRAAGAPVTRPEVRHLTLMSDLARRILPLALAVSEREHDGKTARLVLTGPGGGDWMVPMGGGTPVYAGTSSGATGADVTVTADVVDWCLLVGDRVAPEVLRVQVEGDQSLGHDLVAAAPALATL